MDPDQRHDRHHERDPLHPDRHLSRRGQRLVAVGNQRDPGRGGREYEVSIWSIYVSGGAAKTVQISVTWYDGAGSTISTSSNFPASGVDTSPQGATAGGTVTAPVGAGFARVNVSYTTNFSNGEVHKINWVNLAPSGPVGLVTADNFKSSVINAGEGAQTVQSIATNGTYVWAALGTSGLHRTLGLAETSTANVPAAPGGGQISLVGYAAPFLLAAGSTSSTSGRNTLWRVDSPLGVTPTLVEIKTHDNPSFAWEGIALGRSCVYVWGNAGGTGEIYKVTFDPNAGTLSTAASPATSWVDGETIHTLCFYAGFIILGTGHGVRIGQADGAGNIDYGGLIGTEWPVRCLEPQDRYCWFGWTRYDILNSGLGRVDLGFQTDELIPAWASDLMTSDATQGDVTSCVTFSPYGYSLSQRDSVRVFAVAGEGVYIEDDSSFVPSGQVETGTVRFSTSEPKTVRSVDLRHHALPAGAGVEAILYLDDTGAPGVIGDSTTTDSFGPATPIDAGSDTAEALELSFILTRSDPDGSVFSQSPELTRWTAKSSPPRRPSTRRSPSRSS